MKKHKVYFGLYGVFIAISAILLILFSKTELHLFLNSCYNSFLDFGFKYVTHMGDGLMVAFVGMVLLFISKRKALVVIVSGMISGLIVQFFKKAVFGAIARPVLHFDDFNIPLRVVDGVEMHANFSFPSGHATVAFVLATSLVLIQRNNKYDLLLILSGFIVAYSRVYLSQHFLSDILAGSIIGVLAAIVIYLGFYSKNMMEKTKLDSPLISF